MALNGRTPAEKLAAVLDAASVQHMSNRGAPRPRLFVHDNGRMF